jgi:uncharacterized membrane-anchored protein
MRTRFPALRFAWAALLLFSAAALRADGPSSPQPTADSLALIASSLHWQSGTISLRNGLATIHLTPDFRYLSPADADKVLHDLWGNPPDPDTLGMIFPLRDGQPSPATWGIVIEYEESGYVKDDDAAKIDYSKLLAQMQQQARDQNSEREKQGYPTVDLVGWATPPHYDAATHKLYWAKDVRFSTSDRDTLNYNIRVLGRRGVLSLNAVAAMDHFPIVAEKMPQVLTMVDFQTGNQYADFDPKVDKIAKYGLATLIAGGALGAAAKLGLFKLFWPALLAVKKFIIIGVVGLAALFKKLTARFSGKNPTPRHLLPPDPPPPPPAS